MRPKNRNLRAALDFIRITQRFSTTQKMRYPPCFAAAESFNIEEIDHIRRLPWWGHFLLWAKDVGP